jgi:hypothetical protein
MLSSTSKEQLLSLEKLALIISVQHQVITMTEYFALELTPLYDHIDQQCRKYMDKIKMPDHCLH